jgi:putative ABC transport system permease protein
VVIAAMLATRTLTADIVVLVPVGNRSSLERLRPIMEQFRADVTAHVGQIEAGLALGAAPAVTASPYVQRAVCASLLPRLDMLKSEKDLRVEIFDDHTIWELMYFGKARSAR